MAPDRVIRLASVFAIVAAAFVFAVGAQAAFPGENGKIAFADSSAGQSVIWTMNADGSGRSQLTHPVSPNQDSWPAWSPDGSALLFQRKACTGSCQPDIWLINANGSGERRVLTGASEPAWSPTGTQLTFLAPGLGCDVPWTANIDGTGKTNLGAFCDADICCFDGPAWAQHGYTYAFSEWEQVPNDLCGPGEPEDCQFGFGPSRLTVGPRGASPNWDPGGQEVAYNTTDWFTSLSHVAAVRTSDHAERVITSGNFYDTEPAWSPDGSQIALVRYTPADNFGLHSPLGIQVVDSGGGTPTQISRTGTNPDWQPVLNKPPDCSGVTADPAVLRPANRLLRLVEVSGASDPDGDPVTLEITGVTQDEPVGGAPDAFDASGETLRVRAERDAKGDGRVYHVAFTASDGRGGECEGFAKVGVPRHRHKPAVDSAPPSFDSLGR